MANTHSTAPFVPAQPIQFGLLGPLSKKLYIQQKNAYLGFCIKRHLNPFFEESFKIYVGGKKISRQYTERLWKNLQRLGIIKSDKSFKNLGINQTPAVWKPKKTISIEMIKTEIWPFIDKHLDPSVNKKDFGLAFVITAILLTAIRVSEARAITVNELRALYSNETATIQTRKKGSNPQIYLIDSSKKPYLLKMIAILEAFMANNIEEIVRVTNGRLTSKFPSLSFHQFRRFSCFKLYSETSFGNAGLKVAQHVLGHQSSKTTLNHYMQPDPSQIKKLLQSRGEE